MKTAWKLGVFALGVVGAFGFAAAAGAAIGPIDVSTSENHSLMSPVDVSEIATSVDIDGYTVTLSGDHVVGESMLVFDVSLAGEPITTETYLGAAGHLVIIRSNDLGYLRSRSIDGTSGSVHFIAEFPTEGTYRLFFDFAHAGRIRTAAFTVEIEPT